jgi:hypothetical protein
MSEQVLDRHWEELKKYAYVLNVGLGTKFTKGVDTKVPAITVQVRKKLPESLMEPNSILPKEIEGIPVDVVEVNPTTWTAALTSVSELHPALQRRRFGLKREENPKVPAPGRKLKGTPSGSSVLLQWMSPIQDQGNCGSCTAFGNIGIMEACIRIAENLPTDPIKLSEAHVFICSGGNCTDGNTIPNTLAFLLNGVCTEACLPYRDVDQACGAGICANWWTGGKKLASWDTLTDPTDIQVMLDTTPLNASFVVHQSFYNYDGGVYIHLGDSDPVVGEHDIGVVGYSASLGAYLCRNSWGTGWAKGCMVNGKNTPGYFWIVFSELDAQMQHMVPDGVIPPQPPYPQPTPSKCKIGKAVADTLNIYSKVAGRQGRFYYLNPPKDKT